MSEGVAISSVPNVVGRPYRGKICQRCDGAASDENWPELGCCYVGYEGDIGIALHWVSRSTSCKPMHEEDRECEAPHATCAHSEKPRILEEFALHMDKRHSTVRRFIESDNASKLMVVIAVTPKRIESVEKNDTSAYSQRARFHGTRLDLRISLPPAKRCAEHFPVSQINHFAHRCKGSHHISRVRVS